MKPASAGLISLLLQTNQYFVLDLYQIKLANGTILYFSNYPVGITSDGQLYLPDTTSGLIFSREKVKSSVGVQVDELLISVAFDVTNPLAVIGNMSFPQACRFGLLDGAQITIRRAIMPNATDISRGSYILFLGMVSDMDIERSVVKIHVKSIMERLTIQMPRNLYQTGCVNTLFDGQCTLNRATYMQSGHIGPQSTTTQLNTDIVNPFGTGDFAEGAIVFTNGPNAGLHRTVKSDANAGAQLTLHSPLPNLCNVNDIIQVYPGCNKTMNRCVTRYNNLANLRATPFVPAPETAY
jgi:uncharacterized phage protein (TIGR02218 family)